MLLVLTIVSIFLTNVGINSSVADATRVDTHL